VSFRLPGNLLEWLLFAMLGSCGFIMQFLLTAGLAYGGPNGEPKHSDVETSAESSASGRRASKDVKASGTRATSMLYTQMLFSLIGDKLVFGVTPTILSWIGSGLILGGAMWVAAANETDKPKEPSKKEWAKEDLAFGAGDGAEVLLQDESSKPDQTDMPGPATQVNDHAIELENMGRNDHESKNVLL
jgi:hypothetical protein